MAFYPIRTSADTDENSFSLDVDEATRNRHARMKMAKMIYSERSFSKV